MSRHRSPVRITLAAIAAFVLAMAFPASAHITGKASHNWKQHYRKMADKRYPTKSALSDPGVLNDVANPVDWTKLKNVPPEFAGGTDFATQEELDAHKDSDDHDGRYFTESELQEVGDINTSTNPVDWTKLKNVPEDIADGDDAGQPAWLLAGNGETTAGTDFLGTTDATALELKVEGARALRLEPGTSPNVIGGFSGNLVTPDVFGATIGGGGSNLPGPLPNTVTDGFGTVGGGQGNRAGNNDVPVDNALYATVSGGQGNQASGPSSTIAGGGSNLASGSNSTIAGGASNLASGSLAAIGGGNSHIASGTNATIAGGFDHDATGPAATIGGGVNNDATSDSTTVAGGEFNTASGFRATVSGGQQNVASGLNSVIGGGGFNGASAEYATAGGGRLNSASMDYATVAGGRNNDAAAPYSTIGGGGPSDLGNPGGTKNVVTDAYGTVGGGGGNQAGNADGTTSDRNYATVGGGLSNDATGSNSSIGGGANNLASATSSTVGGGNNNTASALGATVSGGQINMATSDKATVGGGGSNIASELSATVGGGNNNVASGQTSTIAGGSFNTAGGVAAIGGGNNNSASGTYSSIPGGHRAVAPLYGQMAHASGGFGDANGTAQASEYVLRRTTTSDAPLELFLDGAAARLTLAEDRRLTFEAVIVAASDTGESAGFVWSGMIENVNGVTSMVGSMGPTRFRGALPWDVAASADDTNNALVFTATGQADTNVRWVANVRTAEVFFTVP